MKIKSDYMLRKIATEYIVVPTGQSSVNFNGIMSLNDSGALLFEALQQDTTKDSLLSLVIETYDVTMQQAKKDLECFLTTIQKNGLLE